MMERTVRLSVLDRLVHEAPANRSESIAMLRDSVRRYVEWLLNARRTSEPLPSGLDEVERSVYNFGLPDITSLSADSPRVHQALAELIREAVEAFEPRLSKVDVSVTEADETASRRFRFVIEGMLRTEPNPVQVAFDTEVEPSTGKFEFR